MLGKRKNDQKTCVSQFKSHGNAEKDESSVILRTLERPRGIVGLGAGPGREDEI